MGEAEKDVVEIMARTLRDPWDGALFSETRCSRIAADALSALDAAGFQVVPKVPTEAMLCAGQDVPAGIGGCPPSVNLIYRAMLAASSNGRNG
jgi:hypothetical protein